MPGQGQLLDRLAASVRDGSNISGDIVTERALRDVRAAQNPPKLFKAREIMHSRSMSMPTLSAVSGITPARLRQIVNATRQEEPWFDEAVVISRCLGLGGIVPLITSGDLTHCPTGIDLGADVEMFRSGTRMPLSMAVRLSLRFGLTDPAGLVVTTLHQQIWEALESGERTSTPGVCPWCRAVAPAAGERVPHLPTCLPDNLWGPRNRALGLDESFIPRPLTDNTSRRGISRRAHGVKALRTKLMKTQEQFGAAAGIGTNYIAQIERGNIPLTIAKAERIAAAYRVSIESLYLPPDEDA